MKNNNLPKKSIGKKLFNYLFIPLIIIAGTLFFIYPLFQPEYTPSMGSIETAFITDAKWISQNFSDLWWNNEWYLGFPFYRSYTPLVPFTTAFIHTVFNISVAYAYRILTALGYLLTSVGVYYLTKYLTGKKLSGFLAAVIFQLALGQIFLGPFVDSGSLSHYVTARLPVMTLYGEGPHVMALLFLPWAILFFLKALRNPSPLRFLLASVFISLTALTNPIGFFGLLLMLLVVAIFEIIVEKGGFKFRGILTMVLMTLGLTAFWYNLSYLKVAFEWGSKENILSNMTAFLPFFFVFFFAGGIVYFIFRRRTKLRAWFISLGWALVFFVILLANQRFGVVLAPQPGRYYPELDIVLAILLALIMGKIVSRLAGFAKNKRASQLITYVLGTVVILGGLFMVYGQKDEFIDFSEPNSDITQTTEYQVSQWLKENTDGERVYATGSHGFWLNVFTEVPQVRGGADGAPISNWWGHAVYQINSGENAPAGREGEVAYRWFQALNVSYAVVNFPESRESFHDYRNPWKFEEVKEIKEVYDQKGDKIYKVGLSNPSLFQLVDSELREDLSPLANGVDIYNLEKYSEWIDDFADEKRVEVNKIKNTQYEINLQAKENEGLAIQISYNPGWRAYLDGQRVEIEKDIIDFMYVEIPAGSHELVLKFSPTLDFWWGYFVTILTVIILATYPVWKKKFKFIESVFIYKKKIDEEEDY